jgi:hypothetical protein
MLIPSGRKVITGIHMLLLNDDRRCHVATLLARNSHDKEHIPSVPQIYGDEPPISSGTGA